MKPSDRIAGVETYFFAKKLAEIRRLTSEGKDIINLGIGSPDIDIPKVVLNELIETCQEFGASQYQSYTGIPELRKGFATWYNKLYGVSLNPEKEILPLMGSKEAIMHIHLAFCNPGDTVLIPNPGYPSYSSSAQILGLDIQLFDLIEENNWQPDFKQLASLDLSKCKVMWINYPNMPTGATLDEDSYKKLIRFAKNNNILLVNDNPYSLIRNNEPQSIHIFSDANGDVMELNSLSKSHNMAGFRVGVVTGSEENIKHLIKVKSNFDSGMYKPIQLAAVKALEQGTDWFDALNLEYQKRAEIVFEIIRELGCEFNMNSKGMFVWAKVNAAIKNGEELSDELLYNYNIFVTPGKVFGSNGDQFIRFSLCANQKKLKEALNRIKK